VVDWTLADAAIAASFNEFFVWGLYLRGAADTLAFVALVWALAIPYRAANPA
jgi:hypothetical protein